MHLLLLIYIDVIFGSQLLEELHGTVQISHNRLRFFNVVHCLVANAGTYARVIWDYFGAWE